VARTTGGGANYLDYGTGPSTANGGVGACTIALWIYPSGVTGTQSIFSNWNFTPPHSVLFRLSSTALQGFVYTASQVGGSFNLTVAATTWQHIAMVYNGSTLTGYLDGTAGSTTYSPTGNTATSPVSTLVGSSPHATGTPFGGRIAEVGQWSGVALSADEIKALSRGFTPPLVRRNGLVFYADLLRNNRDQITQTDPTVTGSVTASEHPTRTILPMSPIYHPKGAGGGGGGGNPLWWPARAGSIGELTGGIYA
jgi:hypothetical protein